MGRFLPFYAPNSPKNKNKKKHEKPPWDIMIWHKYTTNYNQVMYRSWDVVCDRCNCYFSYWSTLCPFTPQQPKKLKFWKNEGNGLEISSLYIIEPKIMIRWCTVHEIWCVTDIIISHFDLFLPFYPPTAQKNKILKKWKKSVEISSFYICVPKIIIRWCTVPEIWCVADVITSNFRLFFALIPP